MRVKLRFYIPEIVIGALIAVAIFAMGAVTFSRSSVVQPSNQQAQQGRAAVEQPPASYVEKLSDPIAIFTGLVTIFTCLLWMVGRNQVADSRVIQRAYVGLSHATPPEGGGSALNEENQKIQIAIKNSGQTPAVVKGVRLGTMITEPDAPLPHEPPYDDTIDHPSTQAFLNANSAHYIRRGLGIPADKWLEIRNRKRTLYVIGLVEYIDMFGQWHRAGYARRFAPGRGGNNLDFIAVEFAGDAYNYDIKISEGERRTGKP